MGCQARPASCLASASEPARPTFRLGRELVDKAKPHLNHRLEHQLSNSVARLHRIVLGSCVSEDNANFAVIVGVYHTYPLRYVDVMLQ
ncbi:protein of unknown function [Ralstonia solanacearum CFBP2957]|nr:protein of unknown function [Ralstonia solanacearum CFBP2957]